MQGKDVCTDCGADISHRVGRSFRCEPCQELVDKASQHKFKINQRTKKGKDHYCEDCGKFLGECHFNKQYCNDCVHKRKLDSQKDAYDKNKKKILKRHKKYYYEHRKEIILQHRVYTPEDVRICPDCGDGFNNRPSHAIRCLKCAKIHNKERMYQWQIEKREREQQEDPYINRILVFPICVDCKEIIEGRGHGSRRCTPCQSKHEKELHRDWKSKHPESIKAAWDRHFKKKVAKREKVRDCIHEVNMDGILMKINPRKKYGKKMGFQLIKEFPSRILSSREAKAIIKRKEQPVPAFDDINYR